MILQSSRSSSSVVVVVSLMPVAWLGLRNESWKELLMELQLTSIPLLGSPSLPVVLSGCGLSLSISRKLQACSVAGLLASVVVLRMELRMELLMELLMVRLMECWSVPVSVTFFVRYCQSNSMVLIVLYKQGIHMLSCLLLQYTVPEECILWLVVSLSLFFEKSVK